MMLNEDIAKEGDMTFGDAFDKGLYYSRINVYDFDWFPAYDSTAQEKFEALYEHFGNPSGLYWKTTTFGGMAFSSFDELKEATYEDVGEAKSYWLVWDCDGYTLAAECYDQFDGKETPQETSVTSICVFPDADESYISHVDAGSVVDGYVGCGEAPLCLSGIETEGQEYGPFSKSSRKSTQAHFTTRYQPRIYHNWWRRIGYWNYICFDSGSFGYLKSYKVWLRNG